MSVLENMMAGLKHVREREFFTRKLALYGDNVSKTARRLGMQRSNLYKKLEKHGIRAKGGRDEDAELQYKQAYEGSLRARGEDDWDTRRFLDDLASRAPAGAARAAGEGPVVDPVLRRVGGPEVAELYPLDAVAFQVGSESREVLPPVEVGVQQVAPAVLRTSDEQVEVGEGVRVDGDLVLCVSWDSGAGQYDHAFRAKVFSSLWASDSEIGI